MERSAILIALVLVVAAAIAGSVWAHENASQILGFASVVTVSLFSILRVERMGRTVNDVHTLVNSAMGVQLQLTSVALARIAAMPNATVDDVEAARHAQQLWEDHIRKQSIVDARK